MEPRRSALTALVVLLLLLGTVQRDRSLALAQGNGKPLMATGAAQTTITFPDIAGGFGSSLVLDAAGNPVISYWNNRDLKVLHCGDPGCSSGNTIATPHADEEVAGSTSLTLDAAGNPVVSFLARGDNLELRVLHCGNPSCSSGNTIASPDSEAVDISSFTSLALDAAGNPVVSYYDRINGDLRILHCGNPTCSAGNSITVPDTDGDVGVGASLTLDAAGNPVVSYWNNLDLALRVLHCGDPNCSSGNTITSPATAGNTGLLTSLALDAAGNPVVSFLSSENWDVRVLHCGTPDCSSGNTIAVPDTAADYPHSLKLDTAGNPVISYWGTDGIKVLHCGNSGCSSGNTITSPYTVQFTDRSWGPSLALDAAGNPVISAHYVSLTGSLTVLRCGDPACQPATNFWIGTSIFQETRTLYLGWNAGAGPEGYHIYRGATDDGVQAVLPLVGGPLAPNATSYADFMPLESTMPCYQLLGLDGPEQGQLSDLLCVIPGMANPVTVTQVTLELSQTQLAHVLWQAFGAVDEHLLLAVPMDGSSPRLTALGPSVQQAVDDTGGVTTCYILATRTGTELTNPAPLCAMPGQARDSGALSAVRSRDPNAELRQAAERLREELGRLRIER